MLMINDLSVIPSLNSDVLLLLNDDTHYLYHSLENKFVLLDNSVAQKIAKCCNGHNTVYEIVNTLYCSYHKSNFARIQKDVLEMLTFLEKEGFIKIIS